MMLPTTEDFFFKTKSGLWITFWSLANGFGGENIRCLSLSLDITTTHPRPLFQTRVLNDM
jgi:hypothetical protein